MSFLSVSVCALLEPKAQFLVHLILTLPVWIDTFFFSALVLLLLLLFREREHSLSLPSSHLPPLSTRLFLYWKPQSPHPSYSSMSPFLTLLLTFVFIYITAVCYTQLLSSSLSLFRRGAVNTSNLAYAVLCSSSLHQYLPHCKSPISRRCLSPSIAGVVILSYVWQKGAETKSGSQLTVTNGAGALFWVVLERRGLPSTILVGRGLPRCQSSVYTAGSILRRDSLFNGQSYFVSKWFSQHSS